MTPTIRIFTQALLTPDLSFATLGDARAVPDENGLPRLHRTTRFAEAEIEWHGRLMHGAARGMRRVHSDTAHLGPSLGRQSVRRVDLRGRRDGIRIRRPRQPAGHSVAIPLGRRFPRRTRRSANGRRHGPDRPRRAFFVVPALYEIVEYDPATSIVSVRQNGLWARFDYTGRRLTEFGTNYAPFEQGGDRPEPDKGLSHV